MQTTLWGINFIITNPTNTIEVHYYCNQFVHCARLYGALVIIKKLRENHFLLIVQDNTIEVKTGDTVTMTIQPQVTDIFLHIKL